MGETVDMSGTGVDTSKLDLLVRLSWMLPYLSNSHRAAVGAAIVEIQRLRHELRPYITAAQSIAPLTQNIGLAATASKDRPES